MLYATIPGKIYLFFVFLIIFFLLSTNVYAKYNINNLRNDCLTDIELQNFYDSAFLELKSIDSTITFSQMKSRIQPADTCATRATLTHEKALYLAELTSASSTENIVMQTGNSPPVIEGQPETSLENNKFYQFVPDASDADGDELDFSVVNLPSWAVFDSTTGGISGVPSNSDLGVYDDIVITVSDGITSAELSAINLTVFEAEQQTEASLLSQIAGYSIAISSTLNTEQTMVDLKIGGDTQPDMHCKTNNTCYFKITPLNSLGNEIILTEKELAGYTVYVGVSKSELYPIYYFDYKPDVVFWAKDLLTGHYYLSIASRDVDGNESALSDIILFKVF